MDDFERTYVALKSARYLEVRIVREKGYPELEVRRRYLTDEEVKAKIGELKLKALREGTKKVELN